MSSIFTDNFPVVSTQAELEKLISKYPTYDGYYVASGSITDRKNKFESLYKEYAPYADHHFLTEVKKQFHQRTWEMYVGCTLLKNNISFSSEDAGPDFLIQNSKKIWIECVACTKGSQESSDKVPPINYGVAQSVPENEMCLRIINSLNKKYKAYETYLKNGTVSEADVFIIAINSGDLDYPADMDIPLILKCLFSIGFRTISMPIEGGESTSGWSTRAHIEKENGSKVPTNFFLNSAHAGISGVLYSSKNVLNHPENLGEDIIVVGNPIAKNPISKEDFVFLKGHYFEKDAHEWSLELS